MAKQVPVTKKAAAKAVSKVLSDNPPKIKITSGQKRTIAASQ
jgi:hypothetical protein